MELKEHIQRILSDAKVTHKQTTEVGRHGSSKGQEVVVNTYSVYGSCGTFISKDWALRAHVMNQLSPLIQEEVGRYLNDN